MKKLFSVRTIILAGSLLLQLNTLCFQSRGAAGDVDLSFDPGSGVNGTVNAIAMQPDGKVIIGGEFTTVKGLVRHGIARLNADGSGDPTFNPATFNPGMAYEAVSSLALQSDGKVLVGSQFPDYVCDEFDCYPFTAFRVNRLNANGSLDSSFIASTDWDAESIAVQSDGKVLIGGYYGLARLNANGSLDSSFNSGTNATEYINSVVVQPDGKVLIGNGNNIVRLNPNGSLDASFNAGSGANNYVNSIALQSNGKVLIGGYFTTVNGTNRHGIARLNANGSLDNSFNPGIGATGAIRSIALQSDGKVLIGGYGTQGSIARFNTDGSLDSSFNTGTGVSGGYDIVNSVGLQPDGKVLIGGSFTTVNGTNRHNVARLNANGSVDSSFDPGRELEIPISTLVVQPDGKVLVGGVYTFINGTNRYGTARLNANGSLDSTFIPSSFNPDIGSIAGEYDYNVATSLAVQSDGKVLVGGYTVHYFNCDDTGCNVDAISFVTRVNANGSRDTNFNLGTAAYSYVYSTIAVQPDGKVLIGGGRIARLNTDGSLDSSFNPGTGAYGVTSVALQADGKVLMGGNFSFVNGTYRQGIARLNADGSLDNNFNPGTGAYEVSSVALQPDGKVLIGGSFTSVNGTNRNRIARLHANGSLDSSFNPGTGANGSVRAIALQSDGNVLIGGDFLTVNGVLRPYVARLYGDSVAPSLNITRSNAFVIVSWPATGLNFQLQETTDLSLPNSWSPVAQPAVTNAGQISVTVPTTVGRKFFRLQSQ